MSAELIELFPRRIEDLAEIIAKEWPDLSEQACHTLATRQVARSLPRPEIAPDDPIFGLFDAYKQAEASYRAAIADMARRHGLPLQNMAKIVQAARKQRQQPAARYLTSAEVAAKYKAISPEEKASFSRKFEQIMGEP
jgi:ribonuclease D